MHPILIEITDNFFIGTYGVMIALGLLAATGLGAWRARNRGLPPEAIYDLAFIAVFSGFLGARLLYIVVSFEEFLADPSGVIFSRMGFVFLGGLIAAAAACILFIRKKGLELWKMADIAGPSVAIGHAFGRIGCHLAGCCFGGVCESPLGIHLHPEQTGGGMPIYNVWTDQVERGLISPDAAHSLPVWPVQLMESAGLFLIVAILLFIGRKQTPKGFVFGLYLVGYSILRFGLEFLRGDIERGVWLGGMLSTSQILSIGIFAVGVWILTTSRKRERWGPLSKDELEEFEKKREREKAKAERKEKISGKQRRQKARGPR